MPELDALKSSAILGSNSFSFAIWQSLLELRTGAIGESSSFLKQIGILTLNYKELSASASTVGQSVILTCDSLKLDRNKIVSYIVACLGAICRESLSSSTQKKMNMAHTWLDTLLIFLHIAFQTEKICTWGDRCFISLVKSRGTLRF
jgi:hypothetical protein